MPVTFRATVAWPLTPVLGRAQTVGKTAFSRPCGNRRRASGGGFPTADTPLKSRLLRARPPSCAKRPVEAAHQVLHSWPHRLQRRDPAAWHPTILGAGIKTIARWDGTGGLDLEASGTSAPSCGQAAGTRLRWTRRSAGRAAQFSELLGALYRGALCGEHFLRPLSC